MRVRGEGFEGPARGVGRGSPRVFPRRFLAHPVRRKGRGVPGVQRAQLAPARRVVGPLRIEELSGTTWVPAGWIAEVLGEGTLRLRRRS